MHIVCNVMTFEIYQNKLHVGDMSWWQRTPLTMLCDVGEGN